MECVDAALKNCLRREMGMKLSPQICFDENGCVNAQNVGSCDDFFVDELLDLSNEEFVEAESVEEDDDQGKASISVSGREMQENCVISTKNGGFSAADDFSSLPASELSVPADDLADLEWLSHFVEDSFSEPFPAGISEPKPNIAGVPPKNSASGSPGPCFKTPVPVKARTKRMRTGGRVWCLGSPPLTESSSSSSASSSSSSTPSHWLIYHTTGSYNHRFEHTFSPAVPAGKKPNRKFPTERVRNFGVQPPRRCSHCGVQKTPQWRTGPLGAKTLCNACGVRFKSGRLLPEYRPACSPTFSSELHSNHHRKVLEMRRKKEVAGVSDSGLAAQAVPSF